MDIEFIELEHRQDIKSIMECCGISLSQAYDLYHLHNCNIQTAINAKIFKSPATPRRLSDSQSDMEEMNNSIDDQQNDPPFSRYRQFLEYGHPFYKKYPIKFLTLIKTENQNQVGQINRKFVRQLEKFIEYQINVRNIGKNIEQGLLWSWKQRFPIGVLILNFTASSKEIVQPLMKDLSLLKQMFTYFKIVGINSKEEKTPPWLCPFIDYSQDSNNFVVLRVNYVDEIEVVDKINLDKHEDIKGKLRNAKSRAIQSQMDELHIIRQHSLMRKGIRHFRPKPIKEKLKIREDGRIRRQQDEDFVKAFRTKVGHLAQSKPNSFKKVSDIEIKARRQQKRKEMIVYSQGMQLKVRVPSGKNYIVCVSGEQRINYLFDYIDCMPEPIGFDRDQKRCFDIIYGGSRGILLGEKKEMPIKEVLQEFQLLIVKQIESP